MCDGKNQKKMEGNTVDFLRRVRYNENRTKEMEIRLRSRRQLC